MTTLSKQELQSYLVALLERQDTLIDVTDKLYDLRQEVLNSMLEKDVPHFMAYNEYGFGQLMGSGNPYDSSIDTLINNIEQEIEEVQRQINEL